MAKEIDPRKSKRAVAFELWMKASNPMVTFFKTMDVTNLVKVSNKKHLKFNMLMDYCIGKAAKAVDEFYLLPVGDKLIQYDTIAVNTIVKNKEGEVSSCDVLFTSELEKFNSDYLKYTKQVAENCKDRDLSENCMVIGTSAIIDTEIDGAVGMNSGIFNNPFEERINLEIEYDKEDEFLLRCLLPKLTLQPVVENSIIHGIERKIGSGTIKIVLKCTEKRLIIEINDDGVGMRPEVLEKLNNQLNQPAFESIQLSKNKGGIAIMNVNNRIHLIYGEEYGMTVYSTPDVGTDTVINLPLITSERQLENMKE